MALLDDIATRLQTDGIGTIGASSGWAIFKAALPDGPDTAVALFETGGDAPEERYALDRPTFQVRVRGDAWGYSAARTKMQDIFAALHAQEANVGSDYVYIYAVQSGPIQMGHDESDRPHLSLNFRVVKKR